MASSIAVSDAERAASAATNIRLQYQSLFANAQLLKGMIEQPMGCTKDQVVAALGADHAVIQAAVDAVK